MSVPRSLRAPFASWLLVAALGAVASSAAAQEGSDESRLVEREVQRLRNTPALVEDPARVRRIVLGLLERGSDEADTALRELLGEPRTHPNVVEQIVRLTLFVAPHRLLDDAVARLRTERGSALEKRIDPALVHVDADVVARLGAIARDPARDLDVRVAAARLVGRTGHADALDVLADLWTGPDRELRDAARDAFDAIVPGAAANAEEARAFVERMRREELPLAEALRRLLRERVAAATPPAVAAAGAGVKEYTELALELLPKASLDQILRLYVLASPVPAVRAAAVKRLATYDYDAAPEPDARVRTARTLFTALRREDSSEVEEQILVTLAALAPAVRGNVPTEDMDALLARVRPGGSVLRSTRLLAARLAGELRDERAVPALEDAFVALGDADAEARLALLSALQQIPVDRTQWLVARVETERRPEILRKLVVLLGRSRDPAAVAAFAALLANPARTDDDDLRREAAQALANQWSARSDTAARDALVAAVISDRDPVVRATAAGALGVAGPGAETTLAALLRAVRDVVPDVRRAAARSAILLDEVGAAAALLPRVAEDPVLLEVYRDHALETLLRDRTPDRAIALADALAAAGQRPLALALVESAVEGAPETLRGRAKLLERLAVLHLEEGRPAEALSIARGLLVDAKDEAARGSAERVLVRALAASGTAEHLAEAGRRLVALRPRLTGADALDAGATLADVHLRRGDPVGAFLVLESLSAETKDVPDSLRRRLALIREDTDRELGAQRKRVLELVRQIGTADDASARSALAAPDIAWSAAWHLGRELGGTRDFASVRRMLVAVEAVTGTSGPRLPDDASDAQIAAAVSAAREALSKVPAPSRPSR